MSVFGCRRKDETTQLLFVRLEFNEFQLLNYKQ